MFDTASPDDAVVTVLAVPWDATMSSFEMTGRNVCRTPHRMINFASVLDGVDVDLNEFGLSCPGSFGIHADFSVAGEIENYNAEAASLLCPTRVRGDEPPLPVEDERPAERRTLSPSSVQRIQELWHAHNDAVEGRFRQLLAAGRLGAVVGGDHSSPYGAMKAFGAHCKARGTEFGILQFDTHADLYDAFDGVSCSHACIMKRVLDDVEALSSVVAVGIRELCTEELRAHAADSRHHVFTAADLRQATLSDGNSGAGGAGWREAVQAIVGRLPKYVWVTFDIDALDLQYCDGTGTPAPGGLTYLQATDVLLEIHRSGRVLCGFDLVEVGSSAAGVNVGARLLYKLAGLQMLGIGAQDADELPRFRGVFP